MSSPTVFFNRNISKLIILAIFYLLVLCLKGNWNYSSNKLNTYDEDTSKAFAKLHQHKILSSDMSNLSVINLLPSSKKCSDISVVEFSFTRVFICAVP